MISREELEKYKKEKGLDLGQTEKDYLLELALMIISRETKNDLVFKGGTCLYKFHGLNRFSEDLDFSGKEGFDHQALFDKLVASLEDYGVKGKLKEVREPFNTILATLRLEGPLYDGRSMTYASIRVDINRKSEVLLPPVLETFYSGYKDVLPFQILCMDKVEIAAEKVRAIMTSDKARDVYDLWFLLKKGVLIDHKLLEKKMEYYHQIFEKKEFESRMANKQAGWEDDLSRLIFGPLPDFTSVNEEIMKKIN